MILITGWREASFVLLESSDAEGWVRFEMWQNNESFPEARKAAKMLSELNPLKHVFHTESFEV